MKNTVKNKRSSAESLFLDVGILLILCLALYWSYRTFYQGIVHYIDPYIYVILSVLSAILFAATMNLKHCAWQIRFLLVVALLSSFALFTTTELHDFRDAKLHVLPEGVMGVFELDNSTQTAILIVSPSHTDKNKPRYFVGAVSGTEIPLQSFMHSSEAFVGLDYILRYVSGWGRIEYQSAYGKSTGFSNYHDVYIGNVKNGEPQGYGLMLLANGAQVEGDWINRRNSENSVYRTDSYTLYGVYDLQTNEYLRYMMVKPNGKKYLRLWNRHRFQEDPYAAEYWDEWERHVKNINRYINRNRPNLEGFTQKYKGYYEKYKDFLN